MWREDDWHGRPRSLWIPSSKCNSWKDFSLALLHARSDERKLSRELAWYNEMTSKPQQYCNEKLIKIQQIASLLTVQFVTLEQRHHHKRSMDVRRKLNRQVPVLHIQLKTLCSSRFVDRDPWQIACFQLASWATQRCQSPLMSFLSLPAATPVDEDLVSYLPHRLVL